MYRRNDYVSVPRPRKVKHVKFFKSCELTVLENVVNDFADSHPEFKILGVKLTVNVDTVNLTQDFIASVTYLENAKGVEYGDYYDDSYEERDID